MGYGGVAPLGGRDIWKSEMKDGAWTVPVNLGSPINSAKDEWHVFVDKAGKLYFESDREGTMGSFDIWVADSDQGPVTNLTIVNSQYSERAVSISDDFIIFAADKRLPGVGNYDIWDGNG
jgi:Tol biopolymer transport system component